MLDNKAIWPGWETVRLIGRGSFGTVYEIERKLFDEVEKSALKVISIPQNESDIEEMYNDGYDSESITSTFNSHLKNIVAEYSLMKKMSGCHNIVTCDDVRYVQHDDGIGWDIYIKMELLTPLVKALPEGFFEELVVNLAKDLCNALVYCKKYDIVHRDIKPQNIFVSENGEYKLGDFGIAKTVEKTMGGTKIGTYKYMAPEVYNNQPYGSAADIYSLGLVMYWLLNERRMPFMPLPPAKLKSGAEEEARNRRLSGETLPAPKNGSKALKEIVLKACAYDVNSRYTSAAEMLADLEKIDCVATAQLPEVVDESFLHSVAQNDELEEEGTVSLFTRKRETTQRLVAEDGKVKTPASVVEPVTETAKQNETPAVKETVTPVKQPEEKEETKVLEFIVPTEETTRIEFSPQTEGAIIESLDETPLEEVEATPVFEDVPDTKRKNKRRSGNTIARLLGLFIFAPFVIGLLSFLRGCIEEVEYKGLEYELIGNTYAVVDVGTCEDTDIYIPSKIYGRKVTAIGDDAFAGCESLTSITIPDSVTAIGDFAFYECTSLTTVTIGDSVTTIGSDAFCDCTNLTSITIPDSVTTIGRSAFGYRLVEANFEDTTGWYVTETEGTTSGTNVDVSNPKTAAEYLIDEYYDYYWYKK